MGRLIYLENLERVRFRGVVRPGDQLITTVVALRGKGPFGKAQVTATVMERRLPIGSLLSDRKNDRLPRRRCGRHEEKRWCRPLCDDLFGAPLHHQSGAALVG